MKTPKNEQETIIRWYQDESSATVYTSSYAMMKRFDKFVTGGDWELTKIDKCEGDIVSKTYRAPKSLLYGRGKLRTAQNLFKGAELPE
ncbi:MAG: hypothetical protein IKH21_01320 [Clostridia bacterium]|nr:hypothetical protein [Clostridia bacterium]